MSLLYEEESYKIRRAVFDVYNELGNNHKELVYQKAMNVSLISQGLKVEREKRLPVVFKGTPVGVYIPDFLINKKIIVELKAKVFLTQEDVKQFWQYLRSTNYRLGFLVNFGKPGQVQIVRRVYDIARK